MKIIRLAAWLALSAALFLRPAAASQGSSLPLGIVGSATSAKIGASPASEGATVYSGDAISTDDGGTLLVRIGALSFELQSGSSAHVYRAPYGAVLELDSGSVVYSTPGGVQNLVIVASDVRVTPNVSQADYGRVTIEDQCNVEVQSQHGQADVRVGSESKTVDEGKAYKVRAENSITYRKYLSPDDGDYHRYHEHAPCAAAYQSVKGKPPIAGGQSRFLYVALGATGVITTIGVLKAFESPNRP
jgi:hypothetical protein